MNTQTAAIIIGKVYAIAQRPVMNETEQGSFENTYKSGLILSSLAKRYLEYSHLLQPELTATENERPWPRVRLWHEGGFSDPPSDPCSITVFEICEFGRSSSRFVVREAKWKNWREYLGARMDESVRKYNLPVWIEPTFTLRDALIWGSDIPDWLARAPSFDLSATRVFPGCIAEDCGICGFDVFGPGIDKAVISLCWQLEPPSTWQPFHNWYREFHKYLLSLLLPETKQSRARYTV